MIMTTVFAHDTTVALFGQRYASASWVLLSLAVGYYVSIALGFNTYVLQVYGKLKFLVYSNLGVCVASLALAFALSPKYGATGAAIANGAVMAAQNVVNQIALVRVLGWGPDPMRWIRPVHRADRRAAGAGGGPRGPQPRSAPGHRDLGRRLPGDAAD